MDWLYRDQHDLLCVNTCICLFIASLPPPSAALIPVSADPSIAGSAPVSSAAGRLVKLVPDPLNEPLNDVAVQTPDIITSALISKSSAKVVKPAMFTSSSSVRPSTSKFPLAAIAPVNVVTPDIVTLARSARPLILTLAVVLIPAAVPLHAYALLTVTTPEAIGSTVNPSAKLIVAAVPTDDPSPVELLRQFL